MTDFGSDISFAPDMSTNLALVSADQVVAEAILRRLSTPRGWFSWDPSYGLDLRMMLNASMTDETVALWRREIANECEKDERVLSANVSISRIGNALTVGIELTTSNGPLSLVLGVSAVTVSLLQAA